MDAIGEAVRAIAGIYIETKRAEALKTVVDEAHDQTDVLCALLEADFDPDGGNLMSAVKLAAMRLEIDADGRLKKINGANSQDYGALVRLYWEGTENKSYVNTVGVATSKAIKQIRKANDALQEALQEPEFAFESPADLQADVKEIQAWTVILKN